MIILALDIGSTSALAVGDKNVFDTNHVELPKGKLLRPARLFGLLQWLEINIDNEKPEAIVYERPFARGMDATRSGWGMGGVIEAIAHKYGVPVVDVTPAEIKKFATGNSRAEKADMLVAAQGFGYEGDNEHEADAVCLLHYAIKHMAHNK